MPPTNSSFHLKELFCYYLGIGFIIIGFVVLTSMKKGMESKVAFLTANRENEENSLKATSVIWWIWGSTAWGIASMFLVVCIIILDEPQKAIPSTSGENDFPS
ncbi:hypothetical protein ACIQ6U_21350 [Lysinibacillus fusiformis]|uniref:hypothetical protein n=1 Tax=Lysinibacillus fusiformis TaxID=28031 RepID=UPI00381AC1D1